MKFKMTGLADDLVHIEVDTGSGWEDLGGKGAYGGYRATLTAPNGQAVCFTAIFVGSWAFAINRLSNNFTEPDWTITRTWPEGGFSEVIEIDVPDDTVLARS